MLLALPEAAKGQATQSAAQSEAQSEAQSGTQTAQPHLLLFESGKGGYPRYRIPSLIRTRSGALLAICEGRKDGGGLQGDVDLVMRRSSDHGVTWTALRPIVDLGKNTAGNPCAVVDQSTGKIWLAFTGSPGRFTEAQIRAGESEGSTEFFVTSSNDDGQTWAKPRNITATTKRPGWTWCGTGPGVGIQLNNGRLLIPAYHNQGPQGIHTASHAIYSDDHGASWRSGANAGVQNGESQALQRRDSSVYLSARTAAGGPLVRSIVQSVDGGRTWQAKRHDESLHDPHCEASLLSLTAGKKSQPPIWLFCHPAGPKRHNLTIRVSRDEGRTWPHACLVRTGNGQYSCMAKLDESNIGVFYDCWERDNYQLYFARIDTHEILGKR